jgi:tripartite-type tricarboxylate transporter receptor subunit TctC
MMSLPPSPLVSDEVNVKVAGVGCRRRSQVYMVQPVAPRSSVVAVGLAGAGGGTDRRRRVMEIKEKAVVVYKGGGSGGVWR